MGSNGPTFCCFYVTQATFCYIYFVRQILLNKHIDIVLSSQIMVSPGAYRLLLFRRPSPCRRRTDDTHILMMHSTKLLLLWESLGSKQPTSPPAAATLQRRCRALPQQGTTAACRAEIVFDRHHFNHFS